MIFLHKNMLFSSKKLYNIVNSIKMKVRAYYEAKQHVSNDLSRRPGL